MCTVKKKSLNQSNTLNLGNEEGRTSLATVVVGQLVGNRPCVQLAHVQNVRLIVVFCSMHVTCCCISVYGKWQMRPLAPASPCFTQDVFKLAGTAVHGSVLSGRAGNRDLGIQEGQAGREEMSWEVQRSHHGRRAEPQHLGQHPYDDR